MDQQVRIIDLIQVEPDVLHSHVKVNPEISPLELRQRELEALGFEEGRQRFRAAHHEAMRKGAAARAVAVRKFFVEGVDRLEQALIYFQETQMGGRGRPHSLEKWMDKLGPATLAYLTMVELIDGIAAKRVFRQTCEAIAVRVQDEARYQRFQQKAKGLYEYKREKLKRTANKRHKKAAMDQAIRFADIDDADLLMVRGERLLIGVRLVELAIESTGLFHVETFTRRTARNQQGLTQMATDKYILATPEALEWITKRAELLEILFPVAGPMVVPPAQWGPNGQRGGYKYQLKGKYALIRKVSKATLKQTEKAAGLLVYDAMNGLQETRWHINNDVLSVVDELVMRGGGRAGIPAFREPPRAINTTAYAALDKEAQRKARQQRAQAMEAYRTYQGAATKVAGVVVAAKRVIDAEAIYFPYSLDFRGRLYSLSAYLNPQGDDMCRGLLHFADRKPLGHDGAYWLAVHGANVIDEMDGIKVSKLTLDERVRFVNDNSERLILAANDPISNGWWMELENPWQVLAFCFEWRAYRDHVSQGGEGESFRSSLPVMLDGSCNGAQHFAAMFRDEEGGAAVNLVPGVQPNDLYDRVAKRALEVVERKAAEGEEMAILWNKSGLISRKLVKRPTMTYFYGSKKFGFKKQISLQITTVARGVFGQKEVVGDDGTLKVVDRAGYACAWLADVLVDVLADVVQSAHAGMLWFHNRATMIAKRNKTVEWEVPFTHFFVRQEYMKMKRKQIVTTLHGTLCKPSYYTATGKVEPLRQKNGVSPNVIHSLDAAALMLMVKQALTDGVTHIAAIHDSFGTHAADTATMRSATRHGFVKLYSHDVAADLEEQLKAQIIGELSDKEKEQWVDMPERGNLDLSGVLVADYFFA